MGKTTKQTGWDVIVIGGGPAGAIAAYHLSHEGFKTLILDKQAFPREKVCGDGLISDAIECLKRARIYDMVSRNGYKIKNAYIYSPSRISINVPNEYITIKRSTLDHILIRHAIEHGAHFLKRNVITINSQPDVFTCTCNNSNEIFSARFGLIATGIDTHLLKNDFPPLTQQTDAIALRKYVRSEYIENNIFVSYDKSIIPGYAWIFPIDKGLYNIGCGIFYNKKPRNYNLKKMYANFTKEFPVAKLITDKKIDETKLLGSRLRCGLKIKGLQHKQNNNSYLAIGETIGTTYPFTGEGIGKAMESGEQAAQFLAEKLQCGKDLDASNYYHLLNQTLKEKYFGYKIAQRWLSNQYINDFVAKRAQKSKFIYDSLTGIINETVNPREVFSIKGIIKSFWG